MSLLKKGVITSLSSYVTMGLGIIQTMILSRALGPENVGALSLIRQLALFGAQIGSFGIPMAVIYYVNKEKLDKELVFNTSFWAIILLSLLSCLVIFLVTTNSSALGSYDFVSISAICLFVFFANTRSLIQSLNVAKQEVRKMSVVEIFPMLVTVALLTIAYFSDHLNLSIAVLLTVIIWPLCGLISVYFINKREVVIKKIFNIKFFLKSLRYGSIINLSDFLIVFNGSITLFILQYIVEELDSVGYMARAISLTTLINTAFISFFRVLYSHWAGLSGKELKRSVEDVLNILFFISLAGSVAIFFCSKWLIIFLYGREFLPAQDLINVLVFGASFYLLGKALLKLFISDGNGKYNLVALFVGAISNLILSVILIKKYGLIGGAYSQLLSGILLTIITCYFAAKKYEISLIRIFLPRRSILSLFKYIKR